MNIPAVIKPEVKLRAVLDSKPLDSQVGAHEEPYGLHQKYYLVMLWVIIIKLTKEMDTSHVYDLQLDCHMVLAVSFHLFPVSPI